ncbi:MAG: phosphatidate cytidylyltransferase [Acidaminococcus intestini]
MLDGLFHHGEGQFLEKTALSTLSLLYIGLPFAHFIFLRSLGEGLLWTVMVGTWASDTFAYFGGRMWGKTPLAPTVSPKKTREGALCGFLGTLAVIYLIGHTYLGYQSVRVLILALLVGFFAPLGDLVESIMKRCCKIKDSGTFFPGHGGVLDRCDSLIFSIPIAYYFVEFFLF